MPSGSPAQRGDDIFRLLVENVKEYAIFALDAAGNVATWNAGAERMKGYTAEQIIGQPYEIFFPPEAAEEGRPRRLLALAREEGQVEDEGWRVRRDGSRFWADALLTALRDEQGELIGYAKVTRDLTDRKQQQEHERQLIDERVARRAAEEAQVAAERRAREEKALREVAHALAGAESIDTALGRLAELAISMVDADGAYVERAAPERDTVEVVAVAGWGHPALGMSVPYPGSLTEEVVSTGEAAIVDDLAAADARPIARVLHETCGRCGAIAAPLRSGEPALGALVVLRREARPRFQPVEAERLMLLTDMGTLALRRAKVVLEAEQHAREERALREAAGAVSAAFTVEDMLPQIARGALEATDADGSVVERLDAAREQLHIVAAAGEIRLRLGESVPYSGSYAEYVIRRGEPIVIPRLASAEYRVPKHWAATCPDCSALVLGLVDGGEVIARARTFAGLVSLAYRKVHLLEESERRRQELERVMESRARLIRGFSHDVKNPLSASLGYVELLQEGFMGTPTSEQSRALGRVRAGMRAAVALIDDLVDLARAESGQIEISPEAVDLRHAVQDMIGQYAAAAEQKNLTMASDLPTTQAPVWTDPMRVRQVLGNLLSNAVKYTPPGGRIEVRITQNTTPRQGDAGRSVSVHVIDTGPGIPREDHERVFTEFTRLAPGVAEGAGLGLSISRRIARLLGGDLTVESEPGHGSNFILWLPPIREGEAPEAGTGVPNRRTAAAD